jgi:alkanesulfonate monooxygenase SsuD/methylene tetrahydromethanopterin reductase-like flavin-dependent oxidoreductase (luciferase family)
MKFDIFLSICQTEVDGYTPSEKVMFQNFFDQLFWADQLGYGTAWVAETHLSCQIQKTNPGHVIPHFKGEIGLNTDILQLAHLAFAKTKKINIGSAIRNIICNGGPIAHAEAVKTFLTLHSQFHDKNRKLELGFAAGRFPFTNTAYNFLPKTELEKISWDILKNKYFTQAVEIFLRLLKGETLNSEMISAQTLNQQDFPESLNYKWNELVSLYNSKVNPNSWNFDDASFVLPCHWQFENIGVIPFEADLSYLNLTVGTHDPKTQIHANKFLPTGIFNLSITPEKVIEETHQRMNQHFHCEGGPWKREYMPRTAMIFLNDDLGKSDLQKIDTAKTEAEKAWRNYWIAMEGTLDPKKVQNAVENTIAGHPELVAEKINSKYHKDDRLMLWFDFNNHNNESIKKSMKSFMEKVAPCLK